ncbi:hypothetical protein NC652_020215 [Populus alba x Populus x berolinensis]|nr:hypothetical protein NC652_020215 [Populus alba x Populus x berolinensis]
MSLAMTSTTIFHVKLPISEVIHVKNHPAVHVTEVGILIYVTVMVAGQGTGLKNLQASKYIKVAVENKTHDLA